MSHSIGRLYLLTTITIHIGHGVECDTLVDKFSRCNCPNFQKMLFTNIGRKGKYIPYKHQYYVFLIVLQANPIMDVCIHNTTLNDDEVAKLLDNDPFVE